MKARRHFLIVWVAVSALALLWARAIPAFAHAVLLSADPAPNALLETAPTQVRLLLTEPVAPAFSRIAVFDQSGRQVDNGDLKSDSDDGTALVVTLPPLSSGTYLVSWEVLSTVDGHTTSGSFPFGVGVAQLTSAPGSVSSTAQRPTPFSTGARWFNLTGLALLLGLLTFRLLVWNPAFKGVELNEADERLDLAFGRASLKVGIAGLALVGLGLIFTLIAQAARINLLSFDNLRTWLGTQFGSLWLVRFLVTTTVGFAMADLYVGLGEGRRGLRGWEWWAGLAALIGLALTTALVSHSAALTQDTQQAIAVDVVHVLAAGVWVGGLLQLALGLWMGRSFPANSRAWLNLSLSLNFSALAAGAVGALLVSGSYLAWKHVGSWTALFGTAYGLTLLAKLPLAVPAFSIAAVNLLIIKPRLDAALDHPEAASALTLQQRFGRLVRAEGVFALLVLAAAGLLTDLQRGQDAPLLSSQAEKVTLAQPAEDLNISLSLEPALVGQNTFDVYVTDASGQPVADAKEVSLRFTFLGQSIGTAEANAPSSGDGHYRVDGGYLSLAGPWQVEVAVRRSEAFDVFAAYRVEAGLSGAIQPVGGQAGLIEQLTKFLTRSGGAATGVFLVLFAVTWSLLAGRAAKEDWQLVLLFLPSLLAFWIGGVQLFTFVREFTPAKFVTNPILPDSASITRGQELYQANCVTCHGPEGRGDGPGAIGLTPPPADFTAGHTESHPDGDLYYWIKEGIKDTAMPAFGDQFDDEDIWHLVNYVRRLSAQEYQPPGPGTSSPGVSDSQAVLFLQQVEGVMNQFASMEAVEVLRDDSGVVTATIIAYPHFNFSREAIDVQFGPTSELSGQSQARQTVTFAVGTGDLRYDYVLEVDPATLRIVRWTMDGPNHHMMTEYTTYHLPATVTPPSELFAPTATPIGTP